ncbi:hypothetical protein DL93DRAFT_2044762, partial [Clavulina sp. PMI_390]
HPAHCDACPDSSQPIRGIRFKCLDCADYDMCSTCVVERRGQHPLEHEFVALHDPLRQEGHNATCDMCESRIVGVRFKCTRCPDYDVCASCFTITKEQHPHHAFVKVTKPKDIMSPTEQFTDVHPAICNSCKTHIIGIRYKCLHPMCADVDLCAHCEALPIPVHPVDHPLVKFK